MKSVLGQTRIKDICHKQTIIVLLVQLIISLAWSTGCRVALSINQDFILKLNQSPADFIIEHNPELNRYRQVFETLRWRHASSEHIAHGSIIVNPTRGGWKFLNFVVKVDIEFDPKTYKVMHLSFDAGTEWSAEEGIDPKLDYSFLDPKKMAAATRPEAHPKFREIVSLLKENDTESSGSFGREIKEHFDSALNSSDSNRTPSDIMVAYYPQHLAIETFENNLLSPAEQLGYLDSLLLRLSNAGYVPHPRH